MPVGCRNNLLADIWWHGAINYDGFKINETSCRKCGVSEIFTSVIYPLIKIKSEA